IAIVLALLLSPVAAFFERIVPTGVAAIASMLVLVAFVAIGVMILTPAVADWVERVPEIARSAERKLQPLREQLIAVQRVQTQIQNITEVPPKGTPKPSVVVVNGDGPFSAVVRTAPEVLASIIFVFVLTAFLLAYRESYYVRLIMLPRTLRGRIRAA